MSILDNNIMIPRNISDYIVFRDNAVKLIKQSYLSLELAENELDQIADYVFPYDARPRESIDKVIKDIDKRLWKKSFDLTGFAQMMDSEARRDFDKSLEDETPEFNENNVRSIFLSAAQDSDKMFSRGIVNVFLRLDKHYKTNSKEAFKVSRKNIMCYMVGSGFGGGLRILSGQFSDGRARLDDIDRVFKTIDNKKFHPRSLESNVNKSLKEMEAYEDEFYRIKGYKNGNMHIEFLRSDLLDKVNKLISEYYDGRALSASS